VNGTSFPSMTVGAGSCVDMDVFLPDAPLKVLMLFLDMPLEVGKATNAALLLDVVDSALVVGYSPKCDRRTRRAIHPMEKATMAERAKDRRRNTTERLMENRDGAVFVVLRALLLLLLTPLLLLLLLLLRTPFFLAPFLDLPMVN